MKPAESFVLPNGMKFIVAENQAASAVALSLWCRVGVLDEPPGMRGLAHFMEHMMFRGSENVPPEGHSRALALMGGDCNAYTSADGTVFHETLPPSGLDEAFQLEADRFRRLALRKDLVEIEKSVVFEEFRHLENQPLSRAWRLLIEKLLAGHPYAVDPLGRREDLAAMTLEDLSAFHRSHYRPGRIFGLVSGKVERSHVEDLAREHFGDWNPEGAEDKPQDHPPMRMKNGNLEEYLSVEVPLVLSLHRLGPAAEEDLPALKVLQAYLSRGESSPLTETLVKKKKLCVEAGGMLWVLSRGGLLGLYGTFLKPAQASKARAGLEQFVAQNLDQNLDETRLFSLLKRFRRDRAYDGYSATRRMEGLGESELTGGGFHRYESELEDLRAVDSGRLRKIMKKLFSPENSLSVLVLPEKAS